MSQAQCFFAADCDYSERAFRQKGFEPTTTELATIAITEIDANISRNIFSIWQTRNGLESLSPN